MTILSIVVNGKLETALNSEFVPNVGDVIEVTVATERQQYKVLSRKYDFRNGSLYLVALFCEILLK